MRKRSFLPPILALVVALMLPLSAAAKDKLFFISGDAEKVTWFDWTTRKQGPILKVTPNAKFVLQGDDPVFAFVLSGGKISFGKPAGPGAIAIIDTRANKVSATLEVGWGLSDYYWGPDRSKVFVITGALGTSPNDKAKTGLYVFNLAEKQIEKVLPLNYNPVASALSPDGKLLAVLTAGLPSKDAAKAVPALLQVYDLEQAAMIAETSLPQNPSEVAFSPDGTRIFILTAGYPNVLDKDYPQLTPDAPVEASLCIWDVAGKALVLNKPVGFGAYQLQVAPDGSSATLLAMTGDKKPAVLKVSSSGEVRTYTPEKPVKYTFQDPQGRVVYLVNELLVDILDMKTWSRLDFILHQEKMGTLVTGLLPDGRGYVFERNKKRLSVYDPATNKITTVSLGQEAKSLVKLLLDKPLDRETVQIIGNKMYLLTYGDSRVAVVDLTTLQLLKEIRVTCPDFLKREQDIYPEAIFLNPLGNGILACSAQNDLYVVPINTETDQLEKGYVLGRVVVHTSVKLGSSGSLRPDETIKIYLYGPLVEPDQKIAYTMFSGILHYIDLTTGKGSYENLGSERWDPQFKEKVKWVYKKPWWEITLPF